MAKRGRPTNEELRQRFLLENQKTTPGLIVASGVIDQSDWDKTTSYDTLMQDYTNMRNGDSFASSSIDIITYPILNSNINVIQPKKEDKINSDFAKAAAEYCDWTLNNLVIGKSNLIRHLNLALPYGFIMFEKVWSNGVLLDDGQYTNQLVTLSPIQHDTIYQFKYNQIGQFSGVKLYKRTPENFFSFVEMISDDLYYFTPFSEFGNIEGRSLLRPARFVWNIKQNVLKSTARAASRGAGIPRITITGTNDQTKDQATLEKAKIIGRTIGNSENTYVIDQEGVMKTELLSLQNQGDNINILNLCNSEIAYNTLTQFIVSGIGSNGSRAATESHKSPYMEALNATVKLMEESLTGLMKEVIDNSPFYGKLQAWEYPQVKLERPKEPNLNEMATNFIGLANAKGITLTDKDEIFIRKMFGLPEISEAEIRTQEVYDNGMQEERAEETEIEDETKSPEDEMVIQYNKRINYIKLTKQPKEITEDVFELNSALEHYDTVYEKADKLINEYYNKAVEDVALQLKKGNKFELKYKQALEDKLFSLFNDGFERGTSDARKELDKVYKSTELAKKPISFKGNKEMLSFSIDLLWDGLENGIKGTMLNQNKQSIANAGGVVQFVESQYKDGQKRNKSTVLANVAGSYTQGRNDQFESAALKDENLNFRYEVRAEAGKGGKVCDVCYPLDGYVLSWGEVQELGLNTTSPLNPHCKGSINCRCQLVPVAGELL